MAEFNEVEFTRVESDDDDDFEMPDIIPKTPTRDRRHLRRTVVDQDEEMTMAPPAEATTIESIEHDVEGSKFIIAVDFGTTFSSVAFVRLDSNLPADAVEADSIKCINHFPNMPTISGELNTAYESVPTELMCFMQSTDVLNDGLDNADHSDNESQVSMDDLWQETNSDDAFQEEEGEPDESKTTNTENSRRKLRNSVWGWGVHSKLLKPENLSSNSLRLTRFKLLLDEGKDAKELREASFKQLKMLEPIKTVDIIAEYLGHLFNHTRKRLSEFHGLRTDSQVEFVLCVPTAWTDRACRMMQEALTLAIRSSQIVRLKNETIDNLFIVAESEAAATHALEAYAAEGGNSAHMLKDMSFLLLDCGGGTVDAVTYTLTRAVPPRMTEVVPPKGISLGSSLLNEKYKELLEKRLIHAEFAPDSLPLERTIAIEVQNFEFEKRKINIVDKKARFDSVHIPDLLAADDESLRIRRNKLDIKYMEMYHVFHDCLRGVGDLMIEQLNAAREKGVNVQMVILTGGFGESPSLRNHLKSILRQKDVKNLLGQDIRFRPSPYVQSAVARGAVLRALRKEFGPERILRSSYGILATELYDPSVHLDKRVRPTRDPTDGEFYLEDIIHWVIDIDTVVEPGFARSFTSRHTFKLNEDFVCVELLYVSSKKRRSGYKTTQKENKGAEVAGRVEVNFTDLKINNQIQPVTTVNAEGQSHTYYEVEYDLWIIIEGRSLRFEARSVLDKEKVAKSGTFCIAASFVPGTQ